MTLALNAYSPVSNKLLIALSGLNRENKLETADGRTEYHYEKHEYGIKDSYLSFTWSQIKQMLLFVGLSDSDGNIIHVKESDLAAAMKCSERTVQRNNKIFSDRGILKWSRLYSGTISVQFTNYLDDIMDLQEITDTVRDQSSCVELPEFENRKFRSKSGYTILTKENLEFLLGLSDVNALRLSLRALRAIEKDIHVNNKEESFFSYAEIKNSIPPYLRYKKAVLSLLSKVEGLFKLEIFDTERKLDRLFHEKLSSSKALAKKVKGGFVASLRPKNEFNARHQRQQEQIVFSHKLTLFAQNMASNALYKAQESVLNVSERVALISSFGLKTAEKALKIIEAEFENNLSATPLTRAFNENSSICLRNLALNLKF